MKISKAQKDAVISLLKEKFGEKNKNVKDEYIAKHSKEINAKINEFLALQDEAIKLLNRLKEIYSKSKNEDIKEGTLKTSGIRCAYNMYSDPKHCKDVLNYTYTRESLLNAVFVSKVEEPDYDKIYRELELATLSKDFDLNGFLNKYLPK